MYLGVFLGIVFLVIPFDICLGQISYPVLDFTSCLLVSGLSGFILRRIAMRDQNADPCKSENCSSRGKCVTEIQGNKLVPKCLCKEGYCGGTCESSTSLPSQTCPCSLRNTVCVENRCVCRCGYTLVDADFDPICSLDCPAGFGDTFFVIPSKFVDRSEIDAMDNINLTDLQISCKSACRSNPRCRSYAIYAYGFGNTCFIYDVTKDDVILGEMNGFTFYQRECNAE